MQMTRFAVRLDAWHHSLRGLARQAVAGFGGAGAMVGVLVVVGGLGLAQACAADPGQSAAQRSNSQAFNKEASNAHQARASASSKRSANVSLVRFADRGQFKLLLNRLKNQYPNGGGLADVQQLMRDLKRYQTHQAQNTKQRREAYSKALKRMNDRMKAGELENAMVAAIQALDLADQPRKFLETPSVKTLTKRTATKAKQARQDTDWVQSLTLFRLLHLLYEKQNRYRDQLKQARRHVRVLGLYAPKVLRQMYKQRAQRLKAQESKKAETSEGSVDSSTGSNSPNAPKESHDQSTPDQNARDQTKPKAHTNDQSQTGDAGQTADHDANAETNDGADAGASAEGAKEDDAAKSTVNPQPSKKLREPRVPQTQTTSWKTRLEGVTQPMLEKTLRWAATKHVSQVGYTPLVIGALNGVEILVQTDGLEQTFPSLKQKQKVKRFEQYLDRTTAWLKRPDKKVTRLDAESVIDRVLAKNKATVNLPQRVLIYEMTEGITSRLDRFTSVIWPYDLTQFARSTRGNFKGIGVKIRGSDLGIEVVSPLANTPAQKAGIKAGDLIVTVDGKDARTWSLNQAVNQITGPEGTDVKLGIDRDGKELVFTMARAKIDIASIRGWKHRSGGGWNYWIDRKDRIGYVRLSQFLPQTADDLDKAVNKMQKDGPINGLILDLRFNPGGLLTSAVAVADRFIDQGPIVSTVDGDRHKNHIERAHRLATYKHFPVVVLINQGSASASEIVSGALQDYHRALIVGNRSFGKGSVQDLFALGHRRARLKLTRQYYELPDGRIIHRKPESKTWGIEPDLHVRMSDQQVAKSLELRQKADVLRSKPEGKFQSKPSKADSNANSKTNSKAKAKADHPAKAHHPAKARDILDQGVDPQLETALLVLETNQVTNRLEQAQANGQLKDQPQTRRSANAGDKAK